MQLEIDYKELDWLIKILSEKIHHGYRKRIHSCKKIRENNQ